MPAARNRPIAGGCALRDSLQVIQVRLVNFLLRRGVIENRHDRILIDSRTIQACHPTIRHPAAARDNLGIGAFPVPDPVPRPFVP